MTPLTHDEMNGQRHPGGFGWRDILLAAGIAVAAIAAFARVWTAAFLNFDDTVYVLDNPHIRSGFTTASLRWIFLSFDPDNWFPLTRLSHLIDYRLFGSEPAGHHAVNVVIHAAASVLLYCFFRSCFFQRPFRRENNEPARAVAVFVALLFALHPLHVQSVAWISERKDVLCAFFWFAALCAWAAWVERPSRARYAAVLALFACGLMSKPMIVTFPVTLLLLDLWPFRRLHSMRRAVAEKLPFFALSAVCAILTWLAQQSSGAIQTFQTYSAALRLSNALVSPWIYLAKTIWPAGLSAVYPWPLSFPLWEPVLGGIGLLLVSAGVLLLRGGRPWLAAGWFWFICTLAPVIGLIQVGEQVRADRYMYVPMVGLAIMLAGEALQLGSVTLRRVAAAAAVVVLAAFGLRTVAETSYWKDSESLFRRAIAVDRANYSAWFYLGNALMNVPGQQSEALLAYRYAVDFRPDFVEARERLARALCEAGECDEGLREFERVLRERPHFATASFDMGNALTRMGRLGDAIPHFRDAVRSNPRYPPAIINLAVAIETLALKDAPRKDGEPQISPSAVPAIREAASRLETAVRLDPTSALAHFDLANALSFLPERRSEAAREFRDTLDLEPGLVDAHNNLGKLLARDPQTAAEGLEHLRTAQRLAPDAARARKIEELARILRGSPLQ
jgi:tetratricopeptide (TPR) repeat protein